MPRRGEGYCELSLDDYWDKKTSVNGKFERGLFDCCEDPGNCIFGLCFPCFLDGIIACQIGN
jgi:hypothetical protein